MEFISNNWPFAVVLIAFIAVAAIYLYKFARKPTDEQIASIKEFLLYAVAEAEKIFGENTGKLKLSYVYGLFVDKFPTIAKFLTFETFSTLVDEVLITFRTLLSSSTAVQDYVGVAVESSEEDEDDDNEDASSAVNE